MAVMFEDQLVPDKTSQAAPSAKDWVDQCQCVHTVELPGSEGWKLCENMIKESLQVTVTKVTRIQNLWLWEAYNFNKIRICKRNSGFLNEMHLFHGTATNDPFKIACGEDGLDVRLSELGPCNLLVF